MKELASHSAAVRELAALLDRHGLTEIALDAGQLHVRLRREPLDGEVRIAPQAPTARYDSAVATPPGIAIEAPFTGVFWRSPKPGEPPFVEVGDWVEPGQVVGLIEANKTFSHINSPVAGRVTAIVAENGQLVQPGQPLMYIDPSALFE